MMDDYLFLTPHRPRAQHFLQVMKKGDNKCIMCAVAVSSVLEKEGGGGGQLICVKQIFVFIASSGEIISTKAETFVW